MKYYNNGEWHDIILIQENGIKYDNSVTEATQWGVVNALADDYENENMLKLMYPGSLDEAGQNVNFIITNHSSLGSGIQWSNILFSITKEEDENIKQAKNIITTNNTTTTERIKIRMPNYKAKFGCVPVFEKTNESYNADITGYVEVREPGTTALLYYWSLPQVWEGVSVNEYFFQATGEEDSFNLYDLTSGNSINVYLTLSSGVVCLDENTLIRKADNTNIPIKELKIGDLVLDEDGEPTSIINIYTHKTDFIRKLFFNDGLNIYATEGHKFKTKDYGTINAFGLINPMELRIVIPEENDKNIKILKNELINEEHIVYEIVTEQGSYVLSNGIVCESEENNESI